MKPKILRPDLHLHSFVQALVLSNSVLMRNFRDGHIEGKFISEISFQEASFESADNMAHLIRFSTAKHAIESETVEIAEEDQYLDEAVHVLFAFVL